MNYKNYLNIHLVDIYKSFNGQDKKEYVDDLWGKGGGVIIARYIFSFIITYYKSSPLKINATTICSKYRYIKFKVSHFQNIS